MSELNVTLVQTELVWESPADNLTHFDRQLETIEATDLIVLPEMFTTGFSMASAHLAETMDGPSIEWMANKAAQKSAVVCGSIMTRVKTEEGDRHYNRFIWMPPDGHFTTYDKRHLFRMSTENDHYTPGDKRVTIELKDFRICPLVCYDLRFPVWSRNDEAFHLLLYVANWPAPRRQHWQTLLKARAVENLCYVVGLNRTGTDGNGVNYAGDSAIIDYNGEPIVELGSEPRIVSETLRLDDLMSYQESFPAWRDRDEFTLV